LFWSWPAFIRLPSPEKERNKIKRKPADMCFE
jgi:hypothetical protein